MVFQDALTRGVNQHRRDLDVTSDRYPGSRPIVQDILSLCRQETASSSWPKPVGNLLDFDVEPNEIHISAAAPETVKSTTDLLDLPLSTAQVTTTTSGTTADLLGAGDFVDLLGLPTGPGNLNPALNTSYSDVALIDFNF